MGAKSQERHTAQRWRCFLHREHQAPSASSNTRTHARAHELSRHRSGRRSRCPDCLAQWRFPLRWRRRQARSLESAAGQIGNMEPSARKLYESLRNTQTLPGFLQILPAHGAGSACGKSLGAVPTSVMDYERRHNAAFSQALSGNETDFVKTILSGQPEPPLYFARMKRDNRRGPKLLANGELPKPKRIDKNDLATGFPNLTTPSSISEKIVRPSCKHTSRRVIRPSYGWIFLHSGRFLR